MKKLILLVLLIASTTTMFAQSNTKSNTTQANKTAKAQYTCPTHPWVKSKIPGSCSMCGTHVVVNRVSSKQGQVVTYSCPMHPDIVNDKAGKMQ